MTFRHRLEVLSFEKGSYLDPDRCPGLESIRITVTGALVTSWYISVVPGSRLPTQPHFSSTTRRGTLPHQSLRGHACREFSHTPGPTGLCHEGWIFSAEAKVDSWLGFSASISSRPPTPTFYCLSFWASAIFIDYEAPGTPSALWPVVFIRTSTYGLWSNSSEFPVPK